MEEDDEAETDEISSEQKWQQLKKIFPGVKLHNAADEFISDSLNIIEERKTSDNSPKSVNLRSYSSE